MNLLGSGRTADVYALDGRRVLRRYRDGGDVTREAATMAYVHALGFPAPAVHSATGPDLVMERLDGPILREAVSAHGHDAAEAGRVLADLHTRLHALPARSGHPDERVLHLDLHPENVVLTDRGPVLIDWTNAADGPADLDVALSAVILAQVAVNPAHAFATVAEAMLAAFLPAAGGRPLRMLERAVARRGADPTMTPAELGLLDAAAARVTALPS
ncbi:phosphotransferase [Pseudonocardia sp. MH-G8]|uniref:phosphotransferase n=1 Tax=Pseudonocardia sp. MH-G8 TaxID=1854588 RepID=UPI0018E9FD32|nr:phosphotransferase [Pseudonocardia sp. MH-G8]